MEEGQKKGTARSSGLQIDGAAAVRAGAMREGNGGWRPGGQYGWTTG